MSNEQKFIRLNRKGLPASGFQSHLTEAACALAMVYMRADPSNKRNLGALLLHRTLEAFDEVYGWPVDESGKALWEIKESLHRATT